ncbi:MAG: DsbC family protein [Betaproteobacteria bacterium]|nr:DsbC family protein [Betaproteobacteria bacterium]
MTPTIEGKRTARKKRDATRVPISILALLAGGLTFGQPASASESGLRETKDSGNATPSHQAEKTQDDAQWVSIREGARLLTELQKLYPGTRFTEVIASPIRGLFEVWMDRNVVYVFSHAPRYFLFGHLFDTETLRDITAARLIQQDSRTPAFDPVQFDQLPFKDAIKTVRGTGKRQLVLFSDPACPYCRRLEAELSEISDVTIHTFLVPFGGEALPISIWCARDRNKAWKKFMLGTAIRQLPPGKPCPNPVARNLELAHTLGISSTPTLIWADGSRTEGFIDHTAINVRLNANTGEKEP